MEYTNEIDISLPLDRVVELFDNQDNLYKWQPDLVSFEHVSGQPGSAGAKSKLRYKMGKKEIEMIETIDQNNLPDQFDLTFNAKGVVNNMSNKFYPIGKNSTKWVVHNIFKFSGFMKFIGIVAPGSFKKQSYKYMEQFKQFAENN